MERKFSRPPDDSELYELFNYGLALYNNGYPFEAHELWEYAWYEERGRTRLTLQALIQISAAIHKHEIGVPAGTCKLLAKALDKIIEVRGGCSAWMGINLKTLEDELAHALEQADQIFNGATIKLNLPNLPSSISPDRIIYIHGFASSPGSKKAAIIANALQNDGYDVVIPDLNQGDFSRMTISRSITQIRGLLSDRNLIIGSSLGGYLASLVAAADDRVKAMILMAPAFDFADKMAARHGEDAIKEWESRGYVEVDHYGTRQAERLNFDFFQDAQKHEDFPKVRVPTYILHGDKDDTVQVARSLDAKQRFTDFIELDVVDDDHSLVNSAGRALEASRGYLSGLGFRYKSPTLDPQKALDLLQNDPRFQG